jgi:hypothetical protein
MCSYHGWKFSGEGACTSIPQAPDSKAQAVAVASPRSCATALPTQVRSLPRLHATPCCLAAMSGTCWPGGGHSLTHSPLHVLGACSGRVHCQPPC